MENRIRIAPDGDGGHVITDEREVELASFTRHEGDHNTGIRLHHGKHSAYIQQRHVTGDGAMRERINRIFDSVGLSDEIDRLRTLHHANRVLWDEKSTTADSERFNELVHGGVLRTSDRSLEIQRDIVAAKMFIRLGVTVTDLCRLGL